MGKIKFAVRGLLAGVFIFFCLMPFTRGCKTVDEKRTEHDASGIRRSEDIAGQTGKKLSGLAEQIDSGRNEVERSLTEVGEIAAVCDRIAETDGRFKERIGNIEGHARKCLEILEEGKREEEILADCCSCGCGSCRCRGTCAWP